MGRETPVCLKKRENIPFGKLATGVDTIVPSHLKNNYALISVLLAAINEAADK